MFPLGIFLDIRLKADEYKRFSLSYIHWEPKTLRHTHVHTRAAHYGDLKAIQAIIKNRKSSNFFENIEVL